MKRVGINLGAPGDRRADDGTLWLDYPSVGGPSPDIPIEIRPAAVEWFRHHSSSVAGNGLRWVAASGCKGLNRITLTLAPEGSEERRYTVRLHFSEPDEVKAGDRVFNVSVQGREALHEFDIVKEAGGPRRVVVRDFNAVNVGQVLTVGLAPARESPLQAPVLCGIEVVANGW